MHTIQAKSILNKTKRRDPWFLDDYTINPYSGCSFNCLYCYIRGSKYGEHMERKTAAKTNAPELLEKQLALRAKKGQYGIIVLASATDPYLHLEEEMQLTKQLLEVILRHRFPVHIITKSDLVLRDLDLIRTIGEQAILPPDLPGQPSQGSFITFSFTTTDATIAKQFEPGATLPEARLKALGSVAKAGILTGVSLMPLLPYISDNGPQLETMFSQFQVQGAEYIFPATLTLFGDEPASSKTLVLKAVEKHYPKLLPKYLQLIGNSHQLPAYYRKAFTQKAKELSVKYELRNSIY